jgi:hypothetical protein
VIRKILIERQIDIPIDLVLIQTEAEAAAGHFLGSPTVQINGLDLEPAARGLSQTGLG